MQIAARLAVGAIALLFTGLGLTFVLNPEAAIATTALTPNGIPGLATMRGALGGAFTTMGIFLAIAAIKQKKEALLVMGVFLAVAIIGNSITLLVDGFDPQPLRSIIAETVFFSICAFAYVTFRKSEAIISQQ